jgi:hypothetical protein
VIVHTAWIGHYATMVDHQEEQRLFSILLDGLDDLYDQRFGGPVGHERYTRTEVWPVRLLIAVGVALQGSAWEPQLMNDAAEIPTLVRNGHTGNDLNDRVLQATDDLRHSIASDM